MIGLFSYYNLKGPISLGGGHYIKYWILHQNSSAIDYQVNELQLVQLEAHVTDDGVTEAPASSRAIYVICP